MPYQDGESYQPSNGSEGSWFEGEFCDQCIHQTPMSDSIKRKDCLIILMAMSYRPGQPEYPKEWVYMDNKPTCTKFVKWDWGNDGDPDDPDNPKAPHPPPDPNQLNLFPLYPNETHFLNGAKINATQVIQQAR